MLHHRKEMLAEDELELGAVAVEVVGHEELRRVAGMRRACHIGAILLLLEDLLHARADEQPLHTNRMRLHPCAFLIMRCW